MALAIRLSRSGAKKRPYYRIVVADSRMPRDGRFIEKVGTYNPVLPKDHDERLRMNEERIKEWIAKGAQPTDRVQRFLENAGILEKKTRNNLNKGKPGKKALERAEERRQKEAEKQEAEAAGSEAAEGESAEA